MIFNRGFNSLISFSEAILVVFDKMMCPLGGAFKLYIFFNKRDLTPKGREREVARNMRVTSVTGC